MARLVDLQTNWKRGMKQDTPRTSMPDGSAWSIIDYIPDYDAALTGRGGWLYGSGTLPSATTQASASNRLLDKNTFSATTYTTSATLTPVVNRLYLAAVTSKTASGTPNTPTLTGGGGLTWVQVATVMPLTARPWRITLFRALKTSGLTSGTLAVSFGGQTSTNCIVSVDEFDGVDTGGTDGSSAVVQSATGAAATGATATVTLAAFGSAANNVAYGATLAEDDASIDPESGYVELSDQSISGQACQETEWKIGQDTAVTSTFASTNWAMIGAEIKAVVAAVTPNYVAAAAYAPFRAAPKLCAISDSGVLATINTSTLVATSIGATTTPLQTTFHQDKLIITSANGTSSPYYFDGATLGTLAGGPPAGKFATVYRDRTVLAGSVAFPTRVYFSDPADPTSWDTTVSWLSVGAPVTGLAALPGALMVFQGSRTTRIRGSTPPPQTDMIEDDPVFNVGCTDARSIATTSSLAAFASPVGVYLTNGTNLPTDLTKACGLKHYWQTLLAGYSAATWTLAGGFYQNNYVIAVMDGSTFRDAFMFNLDNYSAVRLANLTAVCFATGQEIAEELWFGLRDEAKLGKLSSVFTPSAAVKNDADGTPVVPTLETPMYGVNPAGVKSWRFLYPTYDLRDAAADNPTVTVSYVKNPGDTYTTLGTLAETTNRARKRLPMRFNSDGIGFKFVDTSSSSVKRIYGLQADVHAREQSRL